MGQSKSTAWTHRLAGVLALVVVLAVSLIGGSGSAVASGADVLSPTGIQGADSFSPGELEFLGVLADDYGISLAEAIRAYGWQDDFTSAVTKIREVFPLAYVAAEIVDADNAWIAFAGTPPKGALGLIAGFTNQHPAVSVDVRADFGLTEVEIGKVVETVHYAVYGRPEVKDAATSFDHETATVTTWVVLEPGISESVTDDLLAQAGTSLADAGLGHLHEKVTVAVLISPVDVLGHDFDSP